MNNITFLGTGTSQGVPMIGCKCNVCTSEDSRDKRLRTSAHIMYNGVSILIDAGPDFRQQMLREDLCHLDAILLTHHHKDHTGGLDDVRAINYLEQRAFPIYCEKYVQDSLKLEYSYAFSDYKYPGIPEFILKTIGEDPFKINGVTIIPIRAYHYKLPVLGFRIGNLAYITDANYIPESEFEKLKGLSVFVINTVKRDKHISHYSLPEAIEVAQRVGAEKSFLTHLSHQLPVYSELSKELPAGIEPAYDRLKIEF